MTLEQSSVDERRRVYGSLCFQYQDNEAKEIRRVHRGLAKVQKHLEKETRSPLGESWRIERVVELTRSLKRDSLGVDGDKFHGSSNTDVSTGKCRLYRRITIRMKLTALMTRGEKAATELDTVFEQYLRYEWVSYTIYKKFPHHEGFGL